MMVATPSPISLYAARWKAFLITLFFAGFLVVDLLYYFVWPTPTVTNQPWLYQEPAKMLFFIVCGLTCASGVMAGLYWTLTPRPLLELSATSLIYRPFPRPTRTIYWDDVEHITAVAPQTDTSQEWTPVTRLTFWFTFKPHRLSAYRAQQRLQLDINLQLLSLPAGELVQLIGSYHHVQLLHIPRNSQADRTTDQGGRKSSHEH